MRGCLRACVGLVVRVCVRVYDCACVGVCVQHACACERNIRSVYVTSHYVQSAKNSEKRNASVTSFSLVTYLAPHNASRNLRVDPYSRLKSQRYLSYLRFV